MFSRNTIVLVSIVGNVVYFEVQVVPLVTLKTGQPPLYPFTATLFILTLRIIYACIKTVMPEEIFNELK